MGEVYRARDTLSRIEAARHAGEPQAVITCTSTGRGRTLPEGVPTGSSGTQGPDGQIQAPHDSANRGPDMEPRLNPDGAKIRALRIQRGWTQEQLAEIAGISPRTVQRAESAGCAAFETLRALAGAFEKDFDQLLGSTPRRVRHHEPQRVSRPAPAAGPTRKSDASITAARSAPSVWSIWTTPRVATVTLAAAMLAGMILSYRANSPSGLHPPGPRPSPASTARAGDGVRVADAATAPASVVVQAAAHPVAEAPGPQRDLEYVSDEPGHESSAGRGAEPLQLADLALQATILSPPQPVSLDLPARSAELQLIRPIPMEIVGWKAASTGPADLAHNGQGPGVVRQAVGQAAQKTGAFLAKAGASVRRAF